jgi:hypothetical protein
MMDKTHLRLVTPVSENEQSHTIAWWDPNVAQPVEGRPLGRSRPSQPPLYQGSNRHGVCCRCEPQRARSGSYSIREDLSCRCRATKRTPVRRAGSCCALQHPLMQRAANAKTLRREIPVQHYREDGTLIEGVVDFVFQEDTPEFNGWTVVDFKTDREIEKSESQYRAQVAAYVEVVRIATELPAQGFLLVV